jgi:hypothetical protein
MMDILLETRDDALDLGRLFRDHGWRVTEGRPGCFFASHPEADDQHSTREMLDKLGMLTSKRLHIEIRPR